VKDIRDIASSDLDHFLIEQNEPKFRSKQILEWAWKKDVSSFEEMTNLSKDLRSKLSEHFTINKIEIAEAQVSNDGTVKSVFKLFDKAIVEGVLIPTESRSTACISSQVGCSLTCKFCATGKMKRKRNLMASEIFDQVVEINKQSLSHFDRPLSNIVYMGMGEPLLNYKNTLESIYWLTSEQGLNMSSKRITVSTAGIAKMILKLAEDKVKFNLALSLHAANDDKRNEIMPINEQNNLDVLATALNEFYSATQIKPTFEYIIFKDFNDEEVDAYELVKFCKKVPSKVNIIEYNPIDAADFEQADAVKVDRFTGILESEGITVNVRRSRGKDIDAACGQLANKNKIAKSSSI
jgi:23S rRNA (adenine2503-C2)-methyltransferase